MKFPIFTTFVIFCLLVTIYIKRSMNSLNNIDDDFWKKEQDANAVAKKPLEDIVYISIPEELLNLEISIYNDTVADCANVLKKLSLKKIVNLNGITNTDLKLKYGVANLASLTEYDENYTKLCKILSILGEELYCIGSRQEAKKVLEYAISIKSDTKSVYSLLADIYAENNEFDKIENLIAEAEKLDGIMKNPILKDLKTKSLSSSVLTI